MTKYYEESKARCLIERVGEAWEGSRVRSSTAGKVRGREMKERLGHERWHRPELEEGAAEGEERTDLRDIWILGLLSAKESGIGQN